MKMRISIVCPHCGRDDVREYGTVGRFCADAQAWVHEPDGEDHYFHCGDCDENFIEPRKIALPISNNVIRALEKAVDAYWDGLGGDLRDAARAEIDRRNYETASAARSAALGWNARAKNDAQWLISCGVRPLEMVEAA